MQNLLIAARYANSAYEDQIRGAKKFYNEKTSMVAYLRKERDQDWLAFRGTDSMKDWAYNVNFLPIRAHGSWVHWGFWRAHKSIWPEIRKELDPGRCLNIVGHSLGGALSELSVLCLRNESFREINLYTFGKPNVFAKWQRRKGAQLDFPAFKHQVSVVNSSDVVARVPRIGYRAARNQTQLWFGPNGDLVNPETAIKRQHWDLLDSVSDHDMGEYCKRVEACLNDSDLVAALSSNVRE